MNDRELLQLAAKAAGYDYATGRITIDGIPMNWNPLTDDCDALRLAVKLRLIVDASDKPSISTMWRCGSTYHEHTEDDVDALSAARRSIVMASAEIGRRMP